jgi:uncharacterized protein YaaQ
MAFGVVLFTLLVQGLTMKSFINRMGIIQKSPAQEEYEGLNARAIMSRTAHDQLKKMYQDGLLSKPVWDMLSKPIETHSSNLIDAATKKIETNPDIESRELETAIKEALNTERAILQDLLRDDKISEETFSKLAQEVDAALTNNQSDIIHQLKSQSFLKSDELITIVLQEKDQSAVSDLLESAGFPTTHIASTGGFLGRKNATMLVGIPAGKASVVKSLLKQAITSNLRIGPIEVDDISESQPIGATVFSLLIERHEELL